MTAHDHDAFSERVGPYALGVLAGEEREAFVAHLATCDVCQRDVAAVARIVEGLPQTLDQAPLPPELRARVLAAATAPGGVSDFTPRQRPQPGASRRVGGLGVARTLA